MRRDQPTPFDVEAEEAADITEQFWGSARGWVSRETPVLEQSPDRDDTTGALRAIRAGVAAFRPRRVDRRDVTGRVARTRQHGVVQRDPSRPRDATLAELAGGSDAIWFDDELGDVTAPVRSQHDVASDAAVRFRDELEFGGEPPSFGTDPASDAVWFDDELDPEPGRDPVVDPAEHELVPLTPAAELTQRLGLGAVDPLLLRLGVVMLIGSLLVPLALALRPSRADGAIQTEVSVESTSSGAAPAGLEPATDVAPAEPAPPALAPTASEGPETPGQEAAPVVDAEAAPADESSAPQPTDAPAASVTADEGTDQVDLEVGDVGQQRPSVAGDDAATVDAAAERVVPECSLTYEAGAGDSWYRIADAAGVSPSVLMDENRAAVDTPIFPGDEVCLPSGARVPEQPTPSITEPDTEAAETPATTEAPATTVAPATTAPPTTAPPAPGEVEQIIRDVWPDELEEKALSVAWRESRYNPNAYNGWCCYGLFQIYWTVHDGWLDEYGIVELDDLYDARRNTEAAYAMYQRSGGWGPWGG